MMKYFFWIAFAVFLAASIPHVAYFFASFEPTQGPEGVWWWAVSYAIAISIDVTVYLLSWTAFQRYRKYRTAKAVWQHWLLIVMCTIFSWAVNWAYAKQFHSLTMLSAAETTAPWLTNVFPFMASAFPLLGIVYTMMAETITETAAEEKENRISQANLISELAKQGQLPMTTIRRALTNGTRLTTSHLLANKAEPQNSVVSNESAESSREDPQRPITGQFVTVDSNQQGITARESTNPAITMTNRESSPDKLQMTIEVLKKQPNMTDEALAEFLSLKRPASARFWRLKATEILNAQDKDHVGASQTNGGQTAWTTTGPLVNGATATVKK
jgi:hypothetical protein